MADRFIFILIASGIIAVAATFVSLKRGVPFATVVKLAFVLSLGLALVTGAVVGTFYSHGIVIPWWIFGGAAALAVFLLSVTAGLVFNLARRRKGASRG